MKEKGWRRLNGCTRTQGTERRNREKNSLKSKTKKRKKKLIKKKIKTFHIMGNVLLPKTAEAKSFCKDQKSKKKSEKL